MATGKKENLPTAVRKKVDNTVDFCSDEFNPRRALKAVGLEPPFPNIRPFNNLAEYAVAMQRGSQAQRPRPAANTAPRQQPTVTVGATSAVEKDEEEKGDEEKSSRAMTIERFVKRRLTVTSFKGGCICLCSAVFRHVNACVCLLGFG